MKIKDLKGQRFGRLVAITISEPFHRKQNDKKTYWLCKCDCDKEVIVPLGNLISNNTMSCGCLRKDTSQKNSIKNQSNLIPFKFNTQTAIELSKNYCVNGTNVNAITKKIPTHNSSGVRGVYWDRSHERWIARIMFKNKSYYLGTFIDKEDAIKARKHAEGMLFEPFLEWYEEQKNLNKS